MDISRLLSSEPTPVPPPYIGSREAFSGDVYRQFRGSSSSPDTMLLRMPQHRGRAFPRSPHHPSAPSLGSFSRVGQDGAYEQYSPGSDEFSSPGASVSRELFSAHKEDGDQARRQICEECGSTFVSKAHKLIHLRTVHEKQRVHICTYDNCQKSFGQAGSLSRHISAVHLRIRSHACEYPNCGKAFSERWTLQVHVRNVHLALKPYKCSVPGCGKLFGEKWNQRKHEAGVHGIGNRPGGPSARSPKPSGMKRVLPVIPPSKLSEKAKRAVPALEMAPAPPAVIGQRHYRHVRGGSRPQGDEDLRRMDTGRSSRSGTGSSASGRSVSDSDRSMGSAQSGGGGRGSASSHDSLGNLRRMPENSRRSDGASRRIGGGESRKGNRRAEK